MTLVWQEPARIIVVGNTCSGKSTLANRLAKRMNVAVVDLDDFYWNSELRHAGRAALQDAITTRLANLENWIVDGTYLQDVLELLWPNATGLIWLDPPLHVIVRRVFIRTWKRSRAPEPVHGDHHESFWTLFDVRHPRRSLLWLAFSTHASRKHRIKRALCSTIRSDALVIYLRSSSDIDQWWRFQAARLAGT